MHEEVFTRLEECVRDVNSYIFLDAIDENY